MAQALAQLNNKVWYSMEEALTPLREGSKDSRIFHLLPAIPLLPIGLILNCFVIVTRIIQYPFSFFATQAKKDPNIDFTAILEDSRKWTLIGNLFNKITLGFGDPNFLYGVATCTFQDSGSVHCPESQWADYEKKCLPENNRSGESANFFQLYQTDGGRKQIIDRLLKLGVNSYRFSIEWSHIQPIQGEFLSYNLKIYVDFCKALRDAGIQPMVTLHHFSEPKWFHAMGSFEKEENIKYFVKFTKSVFLELIQPYKGKPLVEYFCTINEPAVEAFSRYVFGSFSPAKMFRFSRAGNFLKGALKAHISVYDALKKIAKDHSADTVKIGIVHQRLTMIGSNIITYLVSRYLNRLLNETMMRFFKKGVFKLKIPFSCNIKEEGFSPKTDFVGLQYYVRPVNGLFGPTSYHEKMTLMPFREDPEGIYEAICETHDNFKVPIIVTENGISTVDEEQRARYMLRSLYAVQRAQKEIGEENLRGYLAWSVCDNSEWNMGKDPQRFGVYALENNSEGKKVLASLPKIGIRQSYMKVIEVWRKSIAAPQEDVA